MEQVTDENQINFLGYTEKKREEPLREEPLTERKMISAISFISMQSQICKC